ncbi:MAG: YncE family protein [Oligoflexales bacterium]
MAFFRMTSFAFFLTLTVSCQPNSKNGLSTGKGTGDVQRLLYVANDSTAQIDVFDINDNHTKIRSFDASANTGTGPMRYRGLSAHPGTARLYLSDSNFGVVAAYDLLTDSLIWVKKYDTCPFPDRINVNRNGTAVFVPCKMEPEHHMVIDANTGDILNTYDMAHFPHNTFVGEQGKYMYLSAYRNPVVYAVEQNTFEKVKEITGFVNDIGSGVRPFSVDEGEQFLFATENDKLGFGVGDIEKGQQIFYVPQVTPSERTQYPAAEAPRPHGGQPPSHGMAVRPGSKEVWFLDDAWGYLYVYDTSPLYQDPPQVPVFKTQVPLFEDITKVWTETRWRWVAMSADGKFVYPASGIVVDGDTKQRLPFKITPSEKLVEIQFENGRPIRVSGQNGGVYN